MHTVRVAHSSHHQRTQNFQSFHSQHFPRSFMLRVTLTQAAEFSLHSMDNIQSVRNIISCGWWKNFTLNKGKQEKNWFFRINCERVQLKIFQFRTFRLVKEKFGNKINRKGLKGEKIEWKFGFSAVEFSFCVLKCLE